MNTNPRLFPYIDWVSPSLTLMDNGQETVFMVQDAFNYHGYDAVGGVVLGFRLLQRAINLLTEEGELLERRELSLFTAFPGMGVRDCFELISRMVSESRFTLDINYIHPLVQNSITGSFYFKFSYRGKSIELSPIEGQPPESFLTIGRASKQENVTEDILLRWTDAKYQLANTLLTVNAKNVIRVL